MADWITRKNQLNKTSLYSFKKSFMCNGADSFKIKISADSRYKLYINGLFVSEGPCRSSPKEKYYEEIDAASVIKNGENIIEVLVLNIKEMSWESIVRSGNCALWFDGLLVTGGEEFPIVSNTDWECTPLEYIHFRRPTVAIPFANQYETVDLLKKTVKYEKAALLYTPEKTFCNSFGKLDDYYLKKRPIPEMYFGNEELFLAVKSNAAPIGCDFNEFTTTKENGYIELDARRLVTADFKLKFKASAGSRIKITYSECRYPQYAENIMTKDIRDDIDGKLIGDYDEIISDGEIFEFNPYTYRTFRYVKIDFENAKELKIYSCKFRHYHYPISDEAKFNCSDEILNKMWRVSINTVKNCSHEIIEDCPYHEQQYIMDSSLTMLYLFRMHSDCRLAKKSILEFCDSIHPCGLTAANFPAGYMQIIPGFSLILIKMIYDYYMNSGDIELVKKTIGTAETILNTFENLIGNNGLILDMPFWNFVDWVDGWHNGTPISDGDKPLTVYNIMYVAALYYMAEIYEFVGRSGSAADYRKLHEKHKNAVNSLCYNKASGLYETRPKSDTYSQHTQVWAVLGHLVTKEEGEALLLRMLDKEDIDKCSFSVNFFLLRALSETGLYEKSDIILDNWRKMFDLHCTTWGESLSFPRSECHGWSSAPLYELSAEYLGVKPIEPGFKTVLISPFTKTIDFANGEVPTPYGKIYVAWKKHNGKVSLKVTSPETITKRVVIGEKVTVTSDACIEEEITE